MNFLIFIFLICSGIGFGLWHISTEIHNMDAQCVAAGGFRANLNDKTVCVRRDAVIELPGQ